MFFVFLLPNLVYFFIKCFLLWQMQCQVKFCNLFEKVLRSKLGSRILIIQLNRYRLCFQDAY